MIKISEGMMSDKDVISNNFIAQAAGVQTIKSDGKTIRELSAKEIKVQWRDVLKIDISDPVLKRHVEGYLDKLQKSAFKYEVLDPSSEKKTVKELSGQEILQRLQNTQAAYLDPQLKDHMSRFMQDGKLVIKSHNTPFNGTAQTGCNTAFLTADGSVPVMINLGTDYLRGARVRNTDGTTSPVTVDAALTNELAHMAFKTSDDNFSDMIENIVVIAMGGKQRMNSTQAQIEFQRGGNFSYQTLYDKLPTKAPTAKSVAGLDLEAVPTV
jgi:hypothetical protein